MHRLAAMLFLGSAGCVCGNPSSAGQDGGGADASVADGGSQGDAGTWNTTDSGTSNDLHAVWASDAEAWAVGVGTILHWNGAAWTPMALPLSPAPVLNGVWSSAPLVDEAWAVGNTADGVVILRWRGTSWSVSWSQTWPGASLNGVFGFFLSQGNHVWAVGGVDAGSLALYWDGGAWAQVDASSIGSPMVGVSGIAENAVYAPTSTTQVAAWDGHAWTALADAPMHCGGGVDADWITTVSGGVYENQELGWAGGPTGVSATLRAVWRLSPTDVWAVGDNGAVVEGIGSPPQWYVRTSTTSQTLRGLAGAGAQALWAVGDHGTILRYEQPCRTDICLGLGSSCVPGCTPCCGVGCLWVGPDAGLCTLGP